MTTRITWTNDNPNTIWNQLKARLGREPTTDEAIAEVKRIMGEARIDGFKKMSEVASKLGLRNSARAYKQIARNGV